MRSIRKYSFMFSCVLTVLLSACGSAEKHPETVPVSGKVTYDGKPVPKGTITFQPADGQPAVGEIQPDGSFQLSTFGEKDGAVLGVHKIMIISNTADPTMIPGSSPGYVKPKDIIPKKYNQLQTSGLEATVSKDKSAYDFDLK
ncbi:hypothetical protein SAMN05444166_7213 [Singulisphaera sp. GP187]|uniref:hypothetical protein n=1 Tax=Singulisphaera sp. GP187 TaxID=1882752 RepID=UPI00092AC4C8|nr:hypothetical protein [Singulisphaera sp. GP187]SIO63004.1 hypothetical protein SAMN05444166_7213 [Singulisphaera sp. GP187]